MRWRDGGRAGCCSIRPAVGWWVGGRDQDGGQGRGVEEEFGALRGLELSYWGVGKKGRPSIIPSPDRRIGTRTTRCAILSGV